jgi:ATP-binding cassette subfamily C protein LapB
MTTDAATGDAADGWILPKGGGDERPEDPLAFCLVNLARQLERPASMPSLVAGLPLVDGRLTPELFVRAAERAGLSARLAAIPLARISPLTLPCVLLLHGRKAAVLTGFGDGAMAELLLPEDGGQARRMAPDELERLYLGYALFARPAVHTDERARASAPEKPERNWFWDVVRQYRTLYGEVIAAAILINILALATPLFTMNVYDRVVPNQAMQTLWVLALGVAIAFAFEFALRMLRGYFVDSAGRGADLQLSSRIFEQVMAIRMAARPPSAGALASNLRDFESLRDFFSSATLLAVVDLPFCALYILFVFVIGGWLGVVPLVAVPVILGVGFVLQAPLREVMRQSFEQQTQKHAVLVEAIAGIETIKACTAEGRMQKTWENQVEATALSSHKAHGLSLLSVTFSQIASNLVNCLLVVAGVYLINAGQLSVGGLIACTILSGRAMGPLGQVASLLVRFHQSLNALRALDRLMHSPTDRSAERRYIRRPRPQGEIEFKGVTFAYPGQKQPALQNVSFKIAPGQKVGLIGRIGSGKSTIERLAMGFYEPQEGAVLIDGVDARQIDPADLRRSIGCVLQENVLFYGSVYDNVVLGAPSADDAAILRAARIAGVEEFTQRHPLGMDLPVGEGGRALSGGQRQSVAIARALLLDPPILLLDEPTSAMDNSSENRFKARLQEILPGKTLLLVTHRGSMLTLVDRLMVIDGGKLVASGPKDEVLQALARGQIQATPA